MTTILTNARLIDPETLTECLGTLVITDGKITEVLTQPFEKTETFPTGKVIDCHGKCLAPGIVDLGVKIGEPGEHHKESFRSAGLAAAAGGVTTIVARPDTLPAIDTPETLEFVTWRATEMQIDSDGDKSYGRVRFERIAGGERVMRLIRQVQTGVA